MGVVRCVRGWLRLGRDFLEIPPGEEGGVGGGKELSKPVPVDPFGMLGGEAVTARGGELHDEEAAADDQAVGPVADSAGELLGRRGIDLGGIACLDRLGGAGTGFAGDDLGHLAAQMPPEFGGVGILEFRAEARTQVLERRLAERMLASRLPGAPGPETVVGRIADDLGADRIELDIGDAVDDGLGLEDDAFEAALPEGAAAALGGAGPVEPAGERLLDGFDELADVAQFLGQFTGWESGTGVL